MTDRYVRKPEISQLTGLSISTIWRLERFSDFPKRRQLGPNSVAWLESEIQDWINSRTPVSTVVE